MKPVQLVLLVFACCIAVAAITNLFLNQTTIVQNWSIPYNISVNNGQVGIVAQATIPLQFGFVATGDTSERYIDVGNSQKFPVKVKIVPDLKTGKWIDASRIYTLAPQETQRVSIRMNVPDSAKPGDYKGFFKVIVYK